MSASMWLWLVILVMVGGALRLGYHHRKMKQAERELLQYAESEEGITIAPEEARPEIDEQVKKQKDELIRL